MTCLEYKELIMGYLDNELEDKQKQILEEHLASCPDCKSELEEFKKLKQMTDSIILSEPEDKMWQQYWSGIYNRIERGIGWILMSIAGILLIIYGGFKAIEELIKDPTVSMLFKIGLLVFIIGIAIMFVSVVRERLYFWKKDRYKDVRR